MDFRLKNMKKSANLLKFWLELCDSDKCVTMCKNKGGGKINPWGRHFPNQPNWTNQQNFQNQPNHFSLLMTTHCPTIIRQWRGWFKIVILGERKRGWWEALFSYCAQKVVASTSEGCVGSENCSLVSWDFRGTKAVKKYYENLWSRYICKISWNFATTNKNILSHMALIMWEKWPW